MNPPFDPKKPVQTRSGLPVVIYCTDAPGEWPIHGRVEGISNALSWRANGLLNNKYKLDTDLINTPEVVEGWTNVYRSAIDGKYYFSPLLEHKQKAADQVTAISIACIHVKFPIGEGIQ